MVTLKKSLGQHFLKDENICRKIIAALSQCAVKRLLEVGPGGGALTKYLIQIEQIEFCAVELDDEKVQYLLLQYPALRGKLMQHDFLELEKPFTEKFTIVGNFPYNISTQILFKVLDWKEDVECMVGMFQKEVARRVVACSGSKVYGVISVLVQAFFTAELLFEVAEGCFQPQPKVKSAVIRLKPRQQPLHMRSEKDFFILVKAAFNQRRKTLRNAVKNIFAAEVLQMEIFKKRAEELSPEQFAALTFMMQ